MTTAVHAPPHPIVGCAVELRTTLQGVAEAQAVFMSAAEKRTALVELAAAEAQVRELRLRVLAVSGDVGEESGARDAAAWMSHATRADIAVARADARLSRRLELRPRVAEGMREGRVSVAQARVITTVLDDLPADLGPQVAADAEATLVAHCEDFRPSELRRLARRLLEVVAPDVAEAEEAKRLEDEERGARAAAYLKMRDLGDGRTRLWGVLPTTVAERFKRYLRAYASPRSAGGAAGEERVPQHRAYARAFGALLELMDPDRMPRHGGDATTVIVTLSLEQLRGSLATAAIVTDHEALTISAGEARRLACSAGIIPAVLGGESEPLDLGRASRLFRAPQRKAIRLRDERCRAEGCTIPAEWSEIHHRQRWVDGGSTDVGDGVCLCSHHHHLVHDERYEHEWLGGGDVRFHRLRR